MPKAKKRIDEMVPVEVSFVDKAANRRKYLIFKSDDGNGNLFPETDESKLDEGASNMPDPIEVKDETVAAVINAALSAKEGELDFEATFKSAGVEFTPEQQVAIQHAARMLDGITISDLPEPIRKAMGIKDIIKVEPTKKADKKPDLSNLTPEAKTQVELVFKSNEELTKKAEAAQAMAQEERDIRVVAEFTKKAADEMGTIANAIEIGPVLKRASETLTKEDYSVIESTLKAAEERVVKGALFSEVGSSASGGGGSAWEKIEKAATALVTESGGKINQTEAIDNVMASQPELYKEYLDERGQSPQ